MNCIVLHWHWHWPLPWPWPWRFPSLKALLCDESIVLSCISEDEINNKNNFLARSFLFYFHFINCSPMCVYIPLLSPMYVSIPLLYYITTASTSSSTTRRTSTSDSSTSTSDSSTNRAPTTTSSNR